jgi:hypothetical protein
MAKVSLGKANGQKQGFFTRMLEIQRIEWIRNACIFIKEKEGLIVDLFSL